MGSGDEGSDTEDGDTEDGEDGDDGDTEDGDDSDDDGVLPGFDRAHREFYRNAPAETRRRIDEARLGLQGCGAEATVPLGLRLLLSGAPAEAVAAALERAGPLLQEDAGYGPPHDSGKMMQWLNGFLRIPFGVIRPMPVTRDSPAADIASFIRDMRLRLDSEVHGHATAKEMIVRTVAKWISNPGSRGNVLGLKGPMGCGKTTLAKACIADVLGLPFCMIPLGGATDAARLTGHLYTYEGATHGAIAAALMAAGSMNPVLLFDELDKLGAGGDDPRGQEVANVLMHVTDPAQNDRFHDNYFANVPLDISRALVVVTFNDPERVNPILLDRMTVIDTPGYSRQDKSAIARKHLLPAVAEQYGFDRRAFEVEPAVVDHIVARVPEEKGVRNLQRALDCVVSGVNLQLLLAGGRAAGAEPEGDAAVRDAAVRVGLEEGAAGAGGTAERSSTRYRVTRELVDAFVARAGDARHMSASVSHIYI